MGKAGGQWQGELCRRSFQPGTNRQLGPQCKDGEGPSWLGDKAAGPSLEPWAGGGTAQCCFPDSITRLPESVTARVFDGAWSPETPSGNRHLGGLFQGREFEQKSHPKALRGRRKQKGRHGVLGWWQRGRRPYRTGMGMVGHRKERHKKER